MQVISGTLPFTAFLKGNRDDLSKWDVSGRCTYLFSRE